MTISRKDMLESAVLHGNRVNSRAASRELARMEAYPRRRKYEKRGKR